MVFAEPLSWGSSCASLHHDDSSSFRGGILNSSLHQCYVHGPRGWDPFTEHYPAFGYKSISGRKLRFPIQVKPAHQYLCKPAALMQSECVLCRWTDHSFAPWHTTAYSQLCLNDNYSAKKEKKKQDTVSLLGYVATTSSHLVFKALLRVFICKNEETNFMSLLHIMMFNVWKSLWFFFFCSVALHVDKDICLV